MSAFSTASFDSDAFDVSGADYVFSRSPGTVIVRHEARRALIDGEHRGISMSCEDRICVVAAENRTHTIARRP